MNQKVFKKIGFTLTKKDMDDAVNCVPDTIERILKILQTNVLLRMTKLIYEYSYNNTKRKRVRREVCQLHKVKVKWDIIK